MSLKDYQLIIDFLKLFIVNQRPHMSKMLILFHLSAGFFKGNKCLFSENLNIIVELCVCPVATYNNGEKPEHIVK